MVQWLGHLAPSAGGLDLIPGQGTSKWVKKQQLELDMEQLSGSKLGKEVWQGCILLLCLFNLHAELVAWLSRVWLFVTPWTVAYQTPPSMGFSRPEYWSGLPFPSPGDLPNPGIEPRSGQTLYHLSQQGSPICRVYHVKCWAGWSTSWNQDCPEKFQQPQMCRWYQPNGRKWRGIKEPHDESESWE